MPALERSRGGPTWPTAKSEPASPPGRATDPARRVLGASCLPTPPRRSATNPWGERTGSSRLGGQARTQDRSDRESRPCLRRRVHRGCVGGRVVLRGVDAIVEHVLDLVARAIALL